MDITSILSAEQKAVLQFAVQLGEYRAENGGGKIRINKLHAHGLVRRHETDLSLCYPTDAGRAAAVALGLIDPIATRTLAVVDVPQSGGAIDTSSEIAAMILRAQDLFDSGDFQQAAVFADAAYADADAKAKFAAKYRAAQALVPKFHELQAAALELEFECDCKVAEAYEAAQEAGEAAKRGRPKNVPDENIFTTEEAGLSRKRMFEARQRLEAKRRDPGIAERAIAARVAQGLSPTRANLNHTISTKTATKDERGNNLYETPVEGSWSILAVEDFSPVVDEPFCGKGAIVRVLEAVGYDVLPSDLVDYGTVTKDGECQGVGDFLLTTEGSGNDIVSNPPYGEHMNACIAHALRVHRPRKMALLLNLGAQAGFEDPDRNFIFEDCPPVRIYVNRRRLPMMHRDGWEGKKATSQMHTMWCVWELQEDGTYGDQTSWSRIDFASDEVTRFRAAHEAESEAS